MIQNSHVEENITPTRLEIFLDYWWGRRGCNANRPIEPIEVVEARPEEEEEEFTISSAIGMMIIMLGLFLAAGMAIYS